MKKILIISAVLMFLLSTILVATSQAWYNSATPWTQSQYDAQHTAACSSTIPSSDSVIWTYDDTSSYGAPSGLVVADGRVFVVRTDGGSFFVLDETTGVRLFSKEVGQSFNLMPAYSDGKLYITVGNYIYGTGAVRCYNATTGDELWNFDTSPGPIYHPPTVSGNRVYVGVTNNYTYCIEDGVQKWYKKLGGPSQSAPAIDGDFLCVGCDDGKVYALNVTGDLPVSLWNFTTSSAVRSPITIKDDKVFCSSSNGYLYVLNRTDGQLIWSWQSQSASDLGIAIAYGIVYVSPTIGNGLYALYANVTAGNYTYNSPEPRLWSDATTYGARFGIAIAGNRLVYVEGNTNLVRAKNALTGANLWSYSSGGTNAVPADDHVFVGANDKVYCIGSAYPAVTNSYDLNVGGQPFTVNIISNSTIGDINVSNITTTKNMTFTVESQWETGVCNITLPNDMLGGPYNVAINGQPPWTYAATPINATYTALYFTYNGTGKYPVEITGTTAIPELTLPMVIMPCGALALSIAVLRKRRRLP